MKRYKQFHQLVISEFEAEYWSHPKHNHNHFELIFIVEGTGIHYLNQKLIPYQKGHLYLLGPEDEHEFEVQLKTRFIYFKFNNLYLDTKDVDNPTSWNRDVDSLLKSTDCKYGNILRDKTDVLLVERLLKLIVEEYQNNKLLNKKIIFQFFKALVLIIKRNQQSCGEKHLNQKTKSSITKELLEYIELHIYEPKKLTLKHIAEHFHLSPNYVGIYFKEHIGTALKQYIQEYRFSLLEQRLKNGQTSTKQLAIDFGFTDESHLHKFVKSQSGRNLTDLKQEM